MKIAIYGVSRSGKNYLIENILRNIGDKIYHLKGSETLNDLSYKYYSCSLNKTNEIQKGFLRKEFVKLLLEKEEQFGNVIVDGHYSFIEKNNYRIVCTEDDKNAYDLFCYLDTPSSMIIDFTRNSIGSKRNEEITEEAVRNWKEYEKYKMQVMCDDMEKELIILDEDTENCVSFLKNYLFTAKLLYAKKPEKVAEQLLSNITIPGSKILLLDCDKTISDNDITYDLCKELRIDTSKLKSIFRNDRYTSYQFYKLNNLYKKISKEKFKESAKVVLDKMNINRQITKLISNAGSYTKIGLTSGIYHIWDLKSRQLGILDNLLACKEYNENPLLITPLVKRSVVKILKDKGYKITSIGDSLIDIPMLEEADNGYIVAHTKLNKSVNSYFLKNNTKISQFTFSEHQYPNIKTVGGIA